MAEKVIANKVKLGPADALALAREADELWVARGQKLVHLQPRAAGPERPSDEQILALLIGPSGTLRAPAVRMGRVVVIGFHLHAYREVFGSR